ncbi:GlxA family transcriptional regulator [Chitinilyticum piscinae]|uniref:DJ-1/PfpI family protein n=1 Tax=Chitinilyticum piscinae TaxID=2866724 RepID=A0A8J7K7J0_9NEIS|nr:DJ-1/PfpI family protein [Chitinilyticum piscinae]MBE9608143.1 DJ-1/PfpI family protein [Chitinilyticum piscinae]
MTEPRRIVFLLYAQVNVLDVAGPLEVFSQPNRNGFAPQATPYLITLASLEGGMVPTSAGAEFATKRLDELAGPIDTLIIPGGLPSAPAVAKAAARLAPRVRRVCSICTGALILAEAGLLAGRRATTHWDYTARLAAFAGVDVVPDALFVRDDAIWTAAGISAGIDLALALVEEDFGHSVAMRIARQMVVFLKRPGGQSQFSLPLAIQSRDARFAELHAWLRANLHLRLDVALLAERMAMSPRSFARHYLAATGQTPAAALASLRLEAATSRVLAGQTLKQIAQTCGYGDEQALRRAFQRAYGITPQEYRQRFG